MSNDLFANTIRALEELDNQTTYSMDVLPDEEGYYDKECPNEDCLSKFKVDADDWANLFSDEEVFCPFCGYSAPANSWWTTEQVEQAKHQAEQMIAAKIGSALDRDAQAFNRAQRKNSLIKMSLKYSGTKHFINLPAEALDILEQRIACDNCGAKYAIVGSAFYCPCCGKNSARLTFNNTINKVQAKINNIDTVKRAISQYSKDEAVRTCCSLIESSVSDLVVAFQRLCECCYPVVSNGKEARRNAFQRLSDGSNLWKECFGEGYEDWLNSEQYNKLVICFQQRHLLQHQDGIVDQDYITKSGDRRYNIGQRIIIKVSDIIEYANVVEILGNKIILLTSKKEK